MRAYVEYLVQSTRRDILILETMHRTKIGIREDNEAVIKSLYKGRMKTMGHLFGTHSIAMELSIQTCRSTPVNVVAVNAKFQIADLFTKASSNLSVWSNLKDLVGIHPEGTRSRRAEAKESQSDTFSKSNIFNSDNTSKSSSVSDKNNDNIKKTTPKNSKSIVQTSIVGCCAASVSPLFTHKCNHAIMKSHVVDADRAFHVICHHHVSQMDVIFMNHVCL